MSSPCQSLCSRLAREEGSFLIEVMVTAIIVLVSGVAVMNLLNRGSELTGEQRVGALADNLAQEEQDKLHAQEIGSLSNLRTSTPLDVDNIRFTVTNRADWVTDAAGEADCTSTNPADYLKIRTTVSSTALGTRKPAQLDTIITPPARSYGANQGSLAVSVVNRDLQPIANQTVSLTGAATLSDATNSRGCIIWGYLPIGAANLSLSRTGWTTPQGDQMPLNVGKTIAAESTAKHQFMLEKAATLSANFKFRNPIGGAVSNVSPLGEASVYSSAFSIGVRPLTLSNTSSVSGSLTRVFPVDSATPYAVYADNCEAARPPAGDAGRTNVVMDRNGGTTTADVFMYPLRVRITKNGGTNLTATERSTAAITTVQSVCNTNYLTSAWTVTGTDSQTAYRGFPFAAGSTSGMTICVRAAITNGSTTQTRWLSRTTVPNNASAGREEAFDLPATAPTSRPAACNP